MAETLIQQTYIEKKADRIIKEFQTEKNESDEEIETQIEEVKSAVKQIQLEVELNDEENLRIQRDKEDSSNDRLI